MMFTSGCLYFFILCLFFWAGVVALLERLI